MRYAIDSELKILGDQLIAKHHPNLKLIKIGYMYREEASVSDGRVTAGMAIRCDDRNWALHKTDALVEIAKDVWDDASPEFREALMDHELKHIDIRFDEDGSPIMDEATGRFKVYLRHHDIEEFADILKRYGAYHDSLRAFLEAFGKKKLEDKKAKKAGFTTGASQHETD